METEDRFRIATSGRTARGRSFSPARCLPILLRQPVMRLVLFCLTAGVTALTLLLSVVSSYSSHWISQTTAYKDGPPNPAVSKVQKHYGLYEECSNTLLDPTTWVCRRFPQPEIDCRLRDEEESSSAEYPLPSGRDRSAFGTSRRPANDMNAKQDQDEDLPSGGTFWDIIAGNRDKRRNPILVTVPSWYAPPRKEYRYSSFCSVWRLAGYFSSLSIAFGGASLLSLLVVLGGGRRRRQSSWPLCASLVGLHALFQIAAFALVVHVYRTDSRFQPDAELGYCAWLSLVSWTSSVVLALTGVVAGYLGHWELPEDSKVGYKPIPG